MILHGLFGMSDNWKTIATHLADSYTVVTIDLPNHGRSPRLKSFNMPLVADTVANFLTDHWMYDVRLIGHSLGAKVAMNMALSHPDLVQQLVSVDMGVHTYKPGHQDIFDALTSLDIANMESRSQADEALAQLISNEGTRLFLLKNLKRTDSGFDWKFDLTTLIRDYKFIIDGITSDSTNENPTLFIRGGQSNYLNFDEHSKDIRHFFPNAHFKTVDNAGHWVHADQPDKLEEILREFFENN